MSTNTVESLEKLVEQREGQLAAETLRADQWKARAATLETQRDEYFRRLQKFDPEVNPLE